ncbi:hypothetical protein V492_08061, partial [Pseudogymnoascus sp. VKM F-4246]
MACTQRQRLCYRARGEAHHKETRLVLFLCARGRGGSDAHEQGAEVLLVQGDISDGGDADAVAGEGGDGGVDVAWVGAEERAGDDEDLAGAVAGGVEEARARHFEGVLEGGTALRVLRAEFGERGEVHGGRAGEGGDGSGEPVAHAEDAELGDG